MTKEITLLKKLENIGWKYDKDKFCYELWLGKQRFYTIAGDFLMDAQLNLPEFFYEIYSKLNEEAKGLYPFGFFNVHNILGYLFDNKQLTFEEAKHYV